MFIILSVVGDLIKSLMIGGGLGYFSIFYFISLAIIGTIANKKQTSKQIFKIFARYSILNLIKII